MRPYEVMIILDGTAEGATIDSVLDRVSEVITTRKGKVGQVEKWGRRRFAYELKHRWEGNYTLVEFNLDPSDTAEVDRVLTLSDEVVRHKIVRLPDSVVGQPRLTSNPDAAPEAAASNTGADS